MRLNKFIAGAGVASRRGADRLIAEGRVTVNGRRAELGSEVDPKTDHVKVEGKLIHLSEDKIYLLLYKPPGFICSLKDPGNRPLVTDLVGEYRRKRIYPVGRLDFNSEGLIILTNDGDFALEIGHPSTGPDKTYHVRVRGIPDDKTLEKMRRGIVVDNKKTRPAEVRLLRERKNAWIEVTLKEGHNRQIRKMFQALGHPVVKLRRVKIGPLTISGMKPGQYRLLDKTEIDRLRTV